MRNRWQMIGNIQREAGVWACEVRNSDGEVDAGCTFRFEESHHGIFEGQKSETRKEWRFFLDHPINHCPACHSCNVKRVGDPEKARDLRLNHQLKNYGVAQMKAWLASAPDEIKTRHTWKNYWKVVSE